MSTMPDRIEPMKARLADPGIGNDWDFEVKWDGYRAIAFCGESFTLQGRRLNRINADFPEIAPPAGCEGKVLDGELVVFDEQGRPDFQLMQARRDLGLKASFVVFDLLWSSGTDLRQAPYRERRELLESIGIEQERWTVPDRLSGSLSEVLDATSKLGLEGIVAKDPESPYVEHRRSNYWLKVKHTRSQEFVIGGWIEGKGHRAGTLGALLVGYQDPLSEALRYAGRVGTGFDDQLLSRVSKELTGTETRDSPFRDVDRPDLPRGARWCQPKIVIEVRFTQWTNEGRLRNPVFAGFRPDKRPEEVVREEARCSG